MKGDGEGNWEWGGDEDEGDDRDTEIVIGTTGTAVKGASPPH